MIESDECKNFHCSECRLGSCECICHALGETLEDMFGKEPPAK